jgi:hypothetical protein
MPSTTNPIWVETIAISMFWHIISHAPSSAPTPRASSLSKKAVELLPTIHAATFSPEISLSVVPKLYRNAFHPILNPLRYSWSTRETMPSTLSATVSTVRRRERDGFLALR